MNSNRGRSAVFSWCRHGDFAATAWLTVHCIPSGMPNFSFLGRVCSASRASWRALYLQIDSSMMKTSEPSMALCASKSATFLRRMAVKCSLSLESTRVRAGVAHHLSRQTNGSRAHIARWTSPRPNSQMPLVAPKNKSAIRRAFPSSQQQRHTARKRPTIPWTASTTQRAPFPKISCFGVESLSDRLFGALSTPSSSKIMGAPCAWSASWCPLGVRPSDHHSASTTAGKNRPQSARSLTFTYPTCLSVCGATYGIANSKQGGGADATGIGMWVCDASAR